MGSNSRLYLEIKKTPEYIRCIGFDQNNPHHHLPLDLHMEETTENLKALAPSNWPPADFDLIAAMIHDIAKPVCATPDKKTGYLHFFGHAKASAEMADRIMKRLGVDKGTAFEACWKIKHHDDFINFKRSCQSGHPFFREATVENVAEVIVKDFIRIKIENPKDIDVNATVRSIVTGKAPTWGKVLDFEWEKHIAPECCFMNLMSLCKADAMAQKEVVYGLDGSVQTTREEKVRVLEDVDFVLSDAYDLAVECYEKGAV